MTSHLIYAHCPKCNMIPIYEDHCPNCEVVMNIELARQQLEPFVQAGWKLSKSDTIVSVTRGDDVLTYKYVEGDCWYADTEDYITNGETLKDVVEKSARFIAHMTRRLEALVDAHNEVSGLI